MLFSRKVKFLKFHLIAHFVDQAIKLWIWPKHWSLGACAHVQTGLPSFLSLQFPAERFCSSTISVTECLHSLFMIPLRFCSM